jgi:DNA-binding NtrC family response regulator
MAGEKVLVVDDSKENIEFIVDYVLKPNGYVPSTARDGAQGFRKAQSERPDLILLDMNMPQMTGIEVLEALHREGLEIPVILMTFHGSETLAVTAFRQGVKDYILKPFQVEEMLDAIERALTEVRLRRERDDLMARLMNTNRTLEQRVRELNTRFGQAAGSIGGGCRIPYWRRRRFSIAGRRTNRRTVYGGSPRLRRTDGPLISNTGGR